MRILGRQKLTPPYAMRKQILWITILAALVRLPAIDVVLNGDEDPNFHWYSFIPWKDLLFTHTDPNQHTLFIILARLSMAVFGESELAFRLPVLLAGIFAVPLLYTVVIEYLGSQKVALTASLLLTLAYYPILYSQNGRAYSLTIFMALAMLHATRKLIGGNSPRLWGSVLGALGLAMVLALPSNINFLIALTAFFIVSCWNGQTGTYFRKPFLKKFVPFFFMMGLAVSYLAALYPYLKRSLKISETWEKGARGTLGASADWLPAVSQFLAEPWGLGLYLFFACGLWVLKKERRLYPFLALFLTPIALGFIAGIFGPPRIYLYWSPLILICVASGLVYLQEMAEKVTSRKVGIGATIVLSLSFLVPAVLKLENYYRDQFALAGTKMADARQVLAYTRSLVDSHQLIVLHHSDGVLSHYIGQAVIENNFKALNDGELENILFIAHNKVRLEDRDWVGFGLERLPKRFLKVVDDIGNIRIYRYSGTISKLIPPRADLDFERAFAGVTNPESTTSNIQSPRVFGSQSLAIKTNIKDIKNDGDIIDIDFDFNISNLPPSVGKSGYVLLAYIKKPNRHYAALLKERGKDKDSLSLNYSNSFFIMEKTRPVRQKRPPFDFTHRRMEVGSPLPEQYWEMALALSPITRGENLLTFTFRVGEETSLYDGIQTFFLTGD